MELPIVHNLALTLLPVFERLSVFSVITHVVRITSAPLGARGTDFMTLNLKNFSSSALFAAITSGLFLSLLLLSSGCLQLAFVWRLASRRLRRIL